MSFINWGEESPEQLAARKRMEETMMFEQAAYNAAVAAICFLEHLSLLVLTLCVLE